jgi:hypothetical protein
MKTQIAKLKKARNKKPFSCLIDENIERFFPPVSHMGITSPSRWQQIRPISSQKQLKPHCKE